MKVLFLITIIYLNGFHFLQRRCRNECIYTSRTTGDSESARGIPESCGIGCKAGGVATMIESKRFKDVRTGEIVTQFDILDIKYMEEVV